jgi:lipopolysaccharide export system protein LptC
MAGEPLAALPERRRKPRRGLGSTLVIGLREVASTYLPVLLMAALALATWWLVKNAPQPQTVTSKRVATHDADYLMKGASLQRFDADGRLRVQVHGQLMRHFPDTDTVEADTVRIESYAGDGTMTVATARRAVTNHDASVVELIGGAQVRTLMPSSQPAPAASASAAAASTASVATDRTIGEEPRPIVIDGEQLKVQIKDRRVSSSRAVVLRSGASTIRAAGFDYDEKTQVAQLHGPIKAVIEPGLLSRRASRPGSP